MDSQTTFEALHGLGMDVESNEGNDVNSKSKTCQNDSVDVDGVASEAEEVDNLGAVCKAARGVCSCASEV